MSRSLLELGIDGRVAIVTGAGKGIGRETSIQLAKMGAKVALIGKSMESISKVEKEIKEFSDDVIALECDVGSDDIVNETVKKVADTFGRIDILVNNAGVEVDRPHNLTGADLMMVASIEQYHKVIDTNLIGHYNFMRACIPYMVEQKYGRIVNISSVTAFNGGAASPAYVASKAGIVVQTKCFARTYGPDNILINGIAPGMVDTPMHAEASSEEFEFVASMTPLRRVAQPIDIARVALFLAQENLFMTGETLAPDGGSTMR